VLNGSHSGFAVTSLCPSFCSVPWRAHMHTYPSSCGTHSRPSHRCVGWLKLGLLRVGVSAPSAPSTRLQLRYCLHITCCASRWGCSAAPGRHESVARTRQETQTVSPGLPPPQAVCCGAHACVWRRVQVRCMGQAWVLRLCSPGSTPSSRQATCMLKVARFQKHIADELLLIACMRMKRTRWASHATQSALVCTA
jgi:hypothetical protein